MGKALLASVVVVLLASLARAQIGPPSYPPENPHSDAKAVLGKILFWEEQMSSDNTMACGTCHRPDAGGSDPRFGQHPGLDAIWNSGDDTFGSPGVIRSDSSNDYKPDATFALDEQVTPRYAPTFIGAAYHTELFWEGRAGDQFIDPEGGGTSIVTGGALESQAVGPPLGDGEMAHENRTWSQITAKLAVVTPLALATNLTPDIVNALALDPTYPDLFDNAFLDPAITAERIAFAIATYERSLVPDQTPYDLFVGGNGGAMTSDQIQGFGWFSGQGLCLGCHQLPLTTDDKYHNIGLRPPAEDLGRQIVTGDPLDRGKFKTPQLRNIGLKKRFMHNGIHTTIEETTEFYDRGGDFADNRDVLIKPLNLTQTQKDQLNDFLKNALTDPRVAAGLPPFDRPTLYSETSPPGSNLYGDSTAGDGGFVPQTLAQTPPVVSNPDFKIGVKDALGGSVAFLAVSSTSQSPPIYVSGVPFNVDLLGVFFRFFPRPTQGAGAGNGYATFRVPMPGDPVLIGLPFYSQWLVADPAAPGKLAASQGAVHTIY